MAETDAAALASGRLPNADAVLWARQGEDARTGMRVIDLVPAGGISVRILPDRGLDLGQAWFRGVPLAWVSEVGEAPPIPVGELVDTVWANAFGGGLLVTCGLRNVGAPSEGHGLHGTFSHLRASEVTVERDIERGTITVEGVIVDDLESPELRLRRSIVTHAGVGRVDVIDVTTNRGEAHTEAPILYHCNFGFPVWDEGSAFVTDVEETAVRDNDSEPARNAWTVGQPVALGPEWVLEHRPARGTPGCARVRNPRLGIEVTVGWDTAELPVLNQWIDRNPSMCVLGVEPANCTTRGRSADRAAGRVPFLAGGASRTTGVTITADGI
jgi:hypothetical protein